MSRHNVKPGVTGLAQVRGFRGSTETMDMMENRVKADLNYIENWSLWLDIKIIFLTVANIFKGDDQAI
jgi:putative colanic acid biosynthesis UDP-glucose lipid carrier transferase